MLIWISCLSFENKNSFWIYQFLPLVIYGGACNACLGIYINALMRRTPEHLQGVVSGFLKTVGQVGVYLGNALTATIMGELEPSHTLDEKDPTAEKFNAFLCDIGPFCCWSVDSLHCQESKICKSRSNPGNNNEETAL
jgi:hypothetical protein